jgi:hypothetical protein
MGGCVAFIVATALGIAYFRAGTVRDPAGLGALAPRAMLSRDATHCDPIGRPVLRAGLRRTVSCFWIEPNHGLSFLIDASGRVFALQRRTEFSTRDSALAAFAAVEGVLRQTVSVVESCPSASPQTLAGVHFTTPQFRVSLRLYPRLETSLDRAQPITYSLRLDAGMALAVSCGG